MALLSGGNGREVFRAVNGLVKCRHGTAGFLEVFEGRIGFQFTDAFDKRRSHVELLIERCRGLGLAFRAFAFGDARGRAA